MTESRKMGKIVTLYYITKKFPSVDNSYRFWSLTPAKNSLHSEYDNGPEKYILPKDLKIEKHYIFDENDHLISIRDKEGKPCVRGEILYVA
jgi:hypothetical protein